MGIDYKDVYIDKIIKDYESREYSLYAIAKKYSFPSLKVLSNVLKKYYKIEHNIKLNTIMYFSYEEKQQIFNEYKVLNHSLNHLAAKYMTSIIVIRRVIEEFENLSELRAQRRQKEIEDISVDIEQIIDEMNSGTSYLNIMKKYNVTYSRLKQALSMTEEGRKIIKEKAKNNRRKIEIPEEELVDAYQKGKIKELESAYGVSESTIRNKLKKIYGEHYAYILDTNKKKEMEEKSKFARAYENGYTSDEIAQMFNVSPKDAKNNVNKYYRYKKMEKPRVISESQFKKFLKYNKSIEELIEECKQQNIIIPSRFINQYINKEGGVNIYNIKTIVHEQLAALKDEGKEPNFINPFKLATELKKKGYGTTYQATAILYSLITENDLSIEILKQVDNPEISEAVITLLNKNSINCEQFIQMLNNNKIAYVIYKEENDILKDENEEEQEK